MSTFPLEKKHEMREVSITRDLETSLSLFTASRNNTRESYRASIAREKRVNCLEIVDS